MKILLCDWNGTLLDDTPVWEKAMRETFIAFGKEPPTVAEYFKELETGDYLKVYEKRGISGSREELNAIFVPAYEGRAGEANLFPGVSETLRQLKEEGVFLSLITASKEEWARPLLDKFKISGLFGDCAFHALDKKAVMAGIIEKRGVNPKECYYVGDAPSDMRQAKKAGVGSIAFLTGYIPNDLLENAKADHYIHSFEEILALKIV